MSMPEHRLPQPGASTATMSSILAILMYSWSTSRKHMAFNDGDAWATAIGRITWSGFQILSVPAVREINMFSSGLRCKHSALTAQHSAYARALPGSWSMMPTSTMPTWQLMPQTQRVLFLTATQTREVCVFTDLPVSADVLTVSSVQHSFASLQMNNLSPCLSA